MKKTLEEITVAVDNCIQEELLYVNEQNAKWYITKNIVNKRFKGIFDKIQKQDKGKCRSRNLYLRGIAIVILRSKIIKAVYENGLEVDACLSSDILDYMLPSSDCKAWLKKADSAVIPTSGSAADCKWVLVAYLWTIRESGTRVILQGDVWKKARKYFIKNILEHEYSEFFDGHTDYATLVAKYDYFKDDLNELKEPESNPTELAEEIKTKLTSSAAAINKTIKESSDKIRENITNNISNLTDEIHQTTSTRTERGKNIEVALEKIAEILKKIWNGQKISEEESEHIDAVLRELLARLEARLGSEVMIRMTDKQKETEGLPIGDPVYIIQKGQIALVMSELFKDLSFPKPLLDKYLRDIKEGTEHELEPINPKTIKKYRDLARRPKASK